jgi:hypothetical protein
VGGTSVTYEPVRIRYYEIDDFRQNRRSISFWFERIDGCRLTRDTDVPKIQAILDELGKWETTVASWKFLLLELGLITGDTPDLKHFEIGCGSEIYEISSPPDSLANGYAVTISLKPEETGRRTALGLSLQLPIKEVYEQLKNVPKWEAFQRALKFIKDIPITEERNAEAPP